MQKALSFRDMFAREPDPWQEFMSPTKPPKPSCLPASGAESAATAASATATTTAAAKGRPMNKFLSAMSSSFHRSTSLRGFPEVSKAELDATFDAFPTSFDAEPTRAASPPELKPNRSGQGWTQKLFR
jgi:hypothetical protein